MRAPFVCQSCRDRHLKCTKPEGSDRCERCISGSKDCIQSVSWSFRQVTAVSLKTDSGRSRRQNLDFDASQTWVELPPAVSFVTPNTDLDVDIEAAVVATDPVNDDPGPFADRGIGGSSLDTDTLIDHGILPSVTTPYPLPRGLGSQADASPFASPSLGQGDVAALQDLLDAHQRHNLFLPDDALSSTYGDNPVQDRTTTGRQPNEPYFPITNSISPFWYMSNAREARLFHHYIIHLAPWIDICDKQRHFTVEVPKRASHQPVLRNAILAFSSRQLAILAGIKDTESPKYVSKCLRVMITSLNDPLGHWDENLLAAMIILRLHEEIGEDEDQKCHLFGTTKLLNSISSFASDGGLRESASWVSLRQHIYISFTRQQSLTIDLENYKFSSVFILGDDESWANRIIYVFALILTHVFQQNAGISAEQLDDLDAQVEDWNNSKPWNFAPLWSDAAQEQTQGAWQELYMSHPAHVIGLQYYHLAKMTLAIFDPRSNNRGFASMRYQRATEATVRKHLRAIISLSESNKTIGNAQFQTSHALFACGCYLIDPIEQIQAIESLENIKRRLGWNTDQIIQELKEQWQQERG